MSRIQPQERTSKSALRECSDEELLSRFSIAHDQTAFNALAGRYERMMLKVCMRVLHQRQDAEDACQATLVVLWRKGGLIRDGQKLNNWLYGVAHREALRVRRNKKRRVTHENLREERILAQPINKLLFGELQTLLNATVERLPLKYRIPLILCCLQGKSKVEAAEELGWPEGTVSCRLASGRELLRRWLEWRGVGLSSI